MLFGTRDMAPAFVSERVRDYDRQRGCGMMIRCRHKEGVISLCTTTTTNNLFFLLLLLSQAQTEPLACSCRGWWLVTRFVEWGLAFPTHIHGLTYITHTCARSLLRSLACSPTLFHPPPPSLPSLSLYLSLYLSLSLPPCLPASPTPTQTLSLSLAPAWGCKAFATGRTRLPLIVILL